MLPGKQGSAETPFCHTGDFDPEGEDRPRSDPGCLCKGTAAERRVEHMIISQATRRIEAVEAVLCDVDPIALALGHASAGNATRISGDSCDMETILPA